MKNFVQDKFIENIKAAIPDHLKLADKIADLLNISLDSSYRRIRGETEFDIDEIVTICQYFNISFDTLIATRKSGIVNFSYNTLYDKEDGFDRYLENIKSLVLTVQKNKGWITYAAEDVPIFRIFSEPILGEFKSFCWLKTVINQANMQNRKYRPGILSANQCRLMEEIVKIYNSVNSIEIWTEETVNSSVKGIEYFWESGQIENK
jgi:hypothetical protein